MTARGGFDLAQLDTGFLADPKFVRLARMVPDDETFLACVGLWTMCIAHAWSRDDADVSEITASYPALGAWLAEAHLIHGVDLVGFERKVAKMRQRRLADAERKRAGRPTSSDGVQRSPQESGGVLREVEVEVEVEERNLERTLRSSESTPRARVDRPRSAGLRPVMERRPT